MTRIAIYTDGSCLGNPGPGGWACAAFLGEERYEAFGSEKMTTNNRMELMAAVEACSLFPTLPAEIDIYTDSQYLQKGMTQWLVNWKRNGWLTTQKKPVKNKELWQSLDHWHDQCCIRFLWVKAHDDNPGNEHVDSLARVAASAQMPRTVRTIKKGHD